MRWFRRFVAWLRRRGWGAHQAIAASLAGIGAGVYTFVAAADSSGEDRVVAIVVGALCLVGGLLFFAALVALRNEQPARSKRRSSKVRLSDSSFRWPTRRDDDRGGR